MKARLTAFLLAMGELLGQILYRGPR